MIQNYLVFCVKSDLTFVEGSLPSGKLVANDVNRNSIFVIAPHIGTIITANFITTTQGDLPRTTFGTYVGDKMSVEDLVDKSESYYNLIKDWNIFEFKLPSTTLSFIARNRTGQIGISFSFDEYVIPAIKPIYGDFLGTITSTVGLTNDVGYYVIGGVGLEIYDPKTDEDIELGYNDILVSTIEPAFYKINAYHYKGSTGTVKYTVDPSILNDNFEPIEPSITTQIVGKVNENSNNIALIFTAITTNVNDISGLTARVSTNESDIADLELNVVKTITRTNTHSIETILNRTGNNVDIGSNVRLDVANNGLLKVGINGLSVSNNDVALSVKNSVIADTQGLATKINEPLEAHKISGSAHSDIRSDLATRELASNKGVASGYAPLDNNTKLPLIYLYDSVLGQLEYAGTFNPNDGYPTMTNALSPNRGVRKGDYFISIGNAVIDTVDYKVGDWAIRSGDGTWAKIDNTDAVASVNGKLGVVVLDGLDIVVGGGDNTTLRAKVVSIDQALADIYRKSETYTQLETNNKIALELLNYYTKANTYSKAEVDNLLDTLKAVYGWEESDLGTTTFTTTETKNVALTTFDNYDLVLVSFVHQNEEKTEFHKANTFGSGKLFKKQFDGTAIIEGVKVGTNFAMTTTTLSGGNLTVNFLGLKMSPLTSAKMTHNGEVLEGVLNDLRVDINSVENVASANTFNIKAIEETIRKDVSGDDTITKSGTDIISLGKDVATGPMTATIGGMALKAEQLVVNGDFVDGLTGWAAENGTRTLVGSNIVVLGNGSNANVFLKRNNVLNSLDDYYFVARIKPLTLNKPYRATLYAGYTAVYSNVDIVGAFVNVSQIAKGGSQIFLILSYVDADASLNSQVEVDYLYTFSITNLKANKQFSPLYNTTFDLMDNTQIKAQIDLWVQNGTLPNDNLLSVSGNKRIRSVAEDGITTTDLFLESGVELYNLPNGVKDEIIYRNGKYYVSKKVEKVGGVLQAMAIPTETEIISSGNILGNVKGSVYIDNAISRVKLYTDKITTDYKIANVESVYKLATNGLLVKIDVSKCVINVDKLSFTNVDLDDGDLVWIVYKYIHDNDVFGKTDITFYNDKMISERIKKVEDLVYNTFDVVEKIEPSYEYHLWNTATMTYSTSTFSGWGWGIGVVEKVEGFEVQIQTRDTPFTKLKYTFCDTDKSGTVIREETIDFIDAKALLPNTKYNIKIPLSSPIVDNTKNLYFAFQTNQFITVFNAGNNLGISSAVTAYSTDGNLGNISYMSDISSEPKSVSLAMRIGKVGNILVEKKEEEKEKEIRIILPNEYVAVVGDTLQLFYRGIVEAVNPYNYDIVVLCSKGKAFTRYFEITPEIGDIGEYQLKFIVKNNNGTILEEKETILKIIDKATSPLTQKNILCIGDSLTAGGLWVGELYRRLSGTVGAPNGNGLTNINFIGTVQKTNSVGTYGYEGYGGWSVVSYLIETSPFWDASQSKIDFATYCSRNSFVSIDEVYIMLSWNGLYPQSATALSQQASVAPLKTLIGKIKEAFPSVKINIMGIQLPSLNGGMGASHSISSGYSQTYGNVRSVFGLNLAYQELANDDDYVDFTQHINISGQFDSENNMPETDKPVNIRSAKTEKIGTNGVHPKDEGYLQIADAVYRHLNKRLQ